MKRWFSFVLLLLCAGAALADDSKSVPSTFTDYVTPSTDLSIQYLGLIFGHVSTVLLGHGSSLMAKIFLVLNNGILVVTGVWMAYTCTTMMVGAATDGGFNQPQRKATNTLLRLALGFSLIIPNYATGYSAIQDLIMKVAVEGVRLADDTWAYALQYIANGGFVYNEQTTSSISAQMPAIKNAYLTNSKGLGLVQTIAQDETCMALSQQYSQQNPADPLSRTHPYRAVTSGNTIYFPGLGNTNTWKPSTTSGAVASKCGSVTAFQPASSDEAPTSLLALQALVSDLEPYANQSAGIIANGNTGATGLVTVGGASLTNALLDYMNVVKPAITPPAAGAVPSFFSVAAQRGWFDAGSFYWDLSQYNDNLDQSIDYTTATPSVAANNETAPLVPDSFIQWLSSSSGYIDQSTAKAFTQLDNYASGAAEGTSAGATSSPVWGKYQAWGSNFGDSDKYNPGVAMKGLSDIIPEAVAGLASFVFKYEQSPTAANRSEFFNPISFVMHLGNQCLKSSGTIWSDGAEDVLGWSIAAGICSAISPGATILQTLMNWLTPLFMASALALFVAGFMMTFYAPLYPFLLFLAGAMSWLLYVIEAMVAGPLVCFGLTHPEGHDFLGKSEQSVMLLLGVFLRPVLMVVGFLGSMILTYVGFAVVNFGFSHVLREEFDNFYTAGGATLHTTPDKNLSVINAIYNVVTASPTNSNGQHSEFTGSDMTNFLLIPILFVFYGLVVVEIVNQCFSLIHILPDQVLRWIGGPVQQDRTEGMVQRIGQQVQGVAKQAGEIGGNATMASAQTAGAAVSAYVATGIEAAKMVASAAAKGG